MESSSRMPSDIHANNPNANQLNHGSAMLRALGRDLGSTIHLCSLLPLRELAALNGSCRSWRLWLESDLPARRYIADARFCSSLLHCQWAQRRVAEFHLKAHLEDLTAEAEPPVPLSLRTAATRLLVPGFASSLWTSAAVNVGLAQQPLTQKERRFKRVVEGALQALANFPRLRVLKLDLQAFARPGPLLATAMRSGFAGLSKLRCLHFLGCDSSIPALLQHGSLLVSLEDLSITCDIGNSKHLDLSSLPTVKRLARFCLLLWNADKKKEFWASSTLAAHLAKCTQLTELDCGIWSAIELAEWTALRLNTPLDSEEVQLQDRIGALVRSRVGAAEPVAPLTSLNLDSTVITPAVWSHISQLTTLTHLTPASWRADLSPQQWMRLTHFKRLEHVYLRISPLTIEGGQMRQLDADELLPAMLQCRSLTVLQLGCTQSGGVVLRHSHMHQLVLELPLLRHLALWRLRLEETSVAALASASASLTALSLSECVDLDGSSIVFLSTLPAMPHLTQLHLTDVLGEWSQHPLWLSLRGELLQKLPLLSKFTHNNVEVDTQQERMQYAEERRQAQLLAQQRWEAILIARQAERERLQMLERQEWAERNAEMQNRIAAERLDVARLRRVHDREAWLDRLQSLCSRK